MNKNTRNKVLITVVIFAVFAGIGYYVRTHRAELAPTKTESNLFSLAQVAANQGKHEQAIEYYQQLLQKDPKHAIALRFMLDSYLKLGKTDQIFANLDKLLALDPSIENLEFALSASMQAKDKERSEKYSEELKKAKEQQAKK